MDENEQGLLLSRLEDANAVWRKTEARVAQYSGLTTLTNRKYKWHKMQIARLKAEIEARTTQIQNLDIENDNLAKQICQNKHLIGDLEERFSVLEDRYKRYFLRERKETIRERADDVVKRSRELAAELAAKVERFGLPQARRRVRLGTDVLVLNKNGTYYFEPVSSADFIEEARCLFLELLASDGQQKVSLAQHLLELVHVPHAEIETLFN